MARMPKKIMNLMKSTEKSNSKLDMFFNLKKIAVTRLEDHYVLTLL